jgi:small subunit ribosomal protein S16
MLAIRMRRAGSKSRPFFRVVVTEGKSKLDGDFVESIGHYNPRTRPETLVLDRDRLAHWLKVGARPSNTVRTLVDRMPPVPVAAEAASAPATPPRPPKADAQAAE